LEEIDKFEAAAEQGGFDGDEDKVHDDGDYPHGGSKDQTQDVWRAGDRGNA
jgi:hypothetical protein